MSASPTPITVAYGDGIGPEIMEATLQILDAAGALLQQEVIEIGQKMYEKGHTAGIGEDAWDSLRRTKVFLKAPITTPRGSGYKSLNVTIRKSLSLYANVRPVMSLHPYVRTKHPKMDLVIVRENEEDTYAGIEHRQTDQVVQCLKLITRPGCERICRYAFEYARKNGRKKVSVMVKDNIMKLTDGLFQQVFNEIGEEYPELQKESWIIDIGAARLADTPEIFDVLVMPNLYGDILSDIAAQISGSVGLGGSSNIGESVAMFEAIHGSAPDIAGKGIANPSGLLLGAVMMLTHIGQNEVATRVHNAWLCTIEEGIHTGDIFQEGVSRKRATTKEFTAAVLERLGRSPQELTPVDYTPSPGAGEKTDRRVTDRPRAAKDLVGVDVFLDWPTQDAGAIAKRLQDVAGDTLELLMITNRGVKVWPGGLPETFKTDHWRCRFMGADDQHPIIRTSQVAELYSKLVGACIDVIKTENLYNFDGKPGYSLGQGQ